MTFFGMKDRFTDGDKSSNDLKSYSDTYINVPTNDDDIDGIERYLGWHMYKAGMSSRVLHYLGVLVEKAKK